MATTPGLQIPPSARTRSNSPAPSTPSYFTHLLSHHGRSSGEIEAPGTPSSAIHYLSPRASREVDIDAIELQEASGGRGHEQTGYTVACILTQEFDTKIVERL
jgi:hypothetical protein